VLNYANACVVLAALSVTQQSTVAAQGGAADASDHAIVFELGAAAGWSPSEGLQPGATFAVEITPIEHWLELEAGVTATRAHRTTETTVDLLIKKPWPISRAFEFMAGVGPEVGHATGAEHATFWGLSAVADLMFWPRANVGWYLEPGYEVTFRQGSTRSGLAIAAGLLIGR